VAGGNHGAVYLEHEVLSWFKQLLGFPADAGGILVSGGSMGALTGLTVARHRACTRRGWNVREAGLQAVVHNQETFVLEQVQNDKYTITDGTRLMDLHLIQGNPHAVGMLMVHLPRERVLIEADLFTPPAPNTPPPATASAAAMSLFNNVQRLKLPVDRIAPLHGRVVPWSEFLQFVGKAGTQ
jgi:glyoxylase-like metal-dependent hydrolase (beta-lactamase superfamily II)